MGICRRPHLDSSQSFSDVFVVRVREGQEGEDPLTVWYEPGVWQTAWASVVVICVLVCLGLDSGSRGLILCSCSGPDRSPNNLHICPLRCREPVLMQQVSCWSKSFFIMSLLCINIQRVDLTHTQVLNMSQWCCTYSVQLVAFFIRSLQHKTFAKVLVVDIIRSFLKVCCQS